MVKKGRKTKNLAGFLGEVETQVEIWKTDLVMGWDNDVARFAHDRLHVLQIGIGELLSVNTDLMDDQTTLNEGDFPF